MRTPPLPETPRAPVDRAVLAGVALAAGGLAVVARWEVACAAVLVLALEYRGNRAPRRRPPS